MQMQVQATKDAKGEIVPGGVSINTQRIQTQVRARDSETLVLGHRRAGEQRAAGRRPGTPAAPLAGEPVQESQHGQLPAGTPDLSHPADHPLMVI